MSDQQPTATLAILAFIAVVLVGLMSAAAFTHPSIALENNTDTTFTNAQYTTSPTYAYSITLNNTTAANITHVHLLTPDGTIIQTIHTDQTATTVKFNTYDPKHGPYTLIAKNHNATIATATLDTKTVFL